ncbi:PAAR domain-containing protein [Massilia consociata]|uniref:PAAR domain-containing protein n=1 Tax=Massilia consociata TaxID=760117 RepID=A0ABV6FB64_9BURK
MNIVGWIREGDQAACGGTVAEGEQTFRCDGRAFSFKGAQMSCPQNCVIAEEFAGSILSNSRRRVLHGMKTSAGCPLLSTLNGRDGVRNTPEEVAPIRFTRNDSGEWVGRTNEGFDQHFLLTDQQTGEPLRDRHYRLTCNGKTVGGKSDANGMTQKIAADDPLEVIIEVLPEGYAEPAR